LDGGTLQHVRRRDRTSHDRAERAAAARRSGGPSILVETELTYRQDERLVDELSFRLHGLGFAVVLEGEAMPTGEFACKWRVAEERGAFLLDARAPAALGDVIRPFDRLPELRVGQTWRVRLLDRSRRSSAAGAWPAPGWTSNRSSSASPGVSGGAPGRGREVFVVAAENGQACAYAAPTRVLRQVVNVPLLGRLVLEDEPFDEHLLRHQRTCSAAAGAVRQGVGREIRDVDAEHVQP